MAKQQLNVAVAIILDDQQRVLMVRKRDCDFFQLPGGKIEAGETPSDAVCREVEEEVELKLDQELLEYLGEASGKAMVENDTIVHAHIFTSGISGTANAAHEIEELIWLDPNQSSDIKLALLAQTKTLPIARQYIAERIAPLSALEDIREQLH